jgi:hypothetical protein
MATALDCTGDCSGKAAAIRAAGYDTVIRYYSMSTWKRMGAAEAQALSRAGLRLVAVYQDRQNQPDDFSEAKGKLAAHNAFSYAQSVIFQPTGSAIYFSADFDPTADVVTNQIVPFFRGVRETLLAANGNVLPYRVGIYGSGRTCGMLLDANLVELAWLAQSTGFANYQAFLDSGRWNLSQHMPSTVAGVSCDPDDINPRLPDCGAFTLAPDHFGPALPPAGTGRYMVNASNGLRLRGGPGVNFDVLNVLPAAATVTILHQDGDWAQVDTTGDGRSDGYVFAAYLKPV